MTSNDILFMPYHNGEQERTIIPSQSPPGSSYYPRHDDSCADVIAVSPSTNMLGGSMTPSYPSFNNHNSHHVVSICPATDSSRSKKRLHHDTQIAPPPFIMDDATDDAVFCDDNDDEDILMKRSIAEIESTSTLGPLNNVSIFLDEIPLEEEDTNSFPSTLCHIDVTDDTSFLWSRPQGDTSSDSELFPPIIWKQLYQGAAEEEPQDNVASIMEPHPLVYLQSPQKKRKMIYGNKHDAATFQQDYQYQQHQNNPGNVFVTPSLHNLLPPPPSVTDPAVVAPRRVSCTSTTGSSMGPPSVPKRSLPLVFLKKHDKWYDKYLELCAFYNEHGHCLVPVKMPETGEDLQILSQWVKRQRHQHKLKRMGRHSTLTEERIAALEQLDFVWDSHEAIWNERFCELIQFKAHKGHCNVPTKYPENPQLSIWVKCQRRQYKMYLTGQKTTINMARIEKLDGLGLDWNPRNLSIDDSASESS